MPTLFSSNQSSNTHEHPNASEPKNSPQKSQIALHFGLFDLAAAVAGGTLCGIAGYNIAAGLGATGVGLAAGAGIGAAVGVVAGPFVASAVVIAAACLAALTLGPAVLALGLLAVGIGALACSYSSNEEASSPSAPSM